MMSSVGTVIPSEAAERSRRKLSRWPISLCNSSVFIFRVGLMVALLLRFVLAVSGLLRERCSR
jgi:hypothetical protein